jgi:hypothetical protein
LTTIPSIKPDARIPEVSAHANLRLPPTSGVVAVLAGETMTIESSAVRTPLADFVGSARLEKSDGAVLIHSWWRVIGVRMLAWLWPGGIAIAVGISALLLRAQRFDRLGQNMALSVATVSAIVLGTLIYPRTRSTHGLERLCWVVIDRRRLDLPDLFGPRGRRTALAPLAMLRGGRGLALVGHHIVELRDQSISIELVCTRRGRVGKAVLWRDGQPTEVRAFGRIPRS